MFFAPVFKWNISPRTQATLEVEYQRDQTSLDHQLLPFNKGHFIDLPHNRNLGERNPVENESIFAGLNWSHQFNDDWSIKHQVFFKQKDTNQKNTFTPLNIDLANDRVDRFFTNGSLSLSQLSTILDLTGHFDTWGLKHTVLLGGDYYNFEDSSDFTQNFEDPNNFSRIRLSNPNHPGSPVVNDPLARFRITDNNDLFGLYFQDQIKLPYNVHVTGGFRYQNLHATSVPVDVNGVARPFPAQTVDAVTPRVAVLWQPKKWLIRITRLCLTTDALMSRVVRSFSHW